MADVKTKVANGRKYEDRGTGQWIDVGPAPDAKGNESGSEKSTAQVKKDLGVSVGSTGPRKWNKDDPDDQKDPEPQNPGQGAGLGATAAYQKAKREWDKRGKHS